MTIILTLDATVIVLATVHDAAMLGKLGVVMAGIAAATWALAAVNGWAREKGGERAR